MSDDKDMWEGCREYVDDTMEMARWTAEENERLIAEHQQDLDEEKKDEAQYPHLMDFGYCHVLDDEGRLAGVEKMTKRDFGDEFGEWESDDDEMILRATSAVDEGKTTKVDPMGKIDAFDGRNSNKRVLPDARKKCEQGFGKGQELGGAGPSEQIGELGESSGQPQECGGTTQGQTGGADMDGVADGVVTIGSLEKRNEVFLEATMSAADYLVRFPEALAVDNSMGVDEEMDMICGLLVS